MHPSLTYVKSPLGAARNGLMPLLKGPAYQLKRTAFLLHYKNAGINPYLIWTDKIDTRISGSV